MVSLSDESLLAGMAAGDAQAAATLVRRYQARVFGLARTIVGSSALAEDVAQEAFLKAWRYAGAYDPRRGRVTTWLLTITRNTAIDAVRYQREVPTDPSVLLSALDSQPAGAPGPSDVDSRDDLRRALRELPNEQSLPLVLMVLYGLTARDIAEREGIPVGTVKTRVRVLAPEHEPSAGFESRVLAALPGTRPRRRRRPARRLVLRAAAAVLAAVLVAVLAVGLTWRRTADDRQLAAHYRNTLAVADGRYLAAAGLVAASGQRAGHVFAYQGSPSWLFVELTAAPASGPYAIRLVTTDNRTVSAGICRVTAGSGSYGRTIDLAVSAIRRVELVQPGSPTLVATLH